MSIAEDNRTTEPTTRRDLLTPRQALVFVLVACVPLYFWGLGHPPLFDPDEPVYAATGREMLRSHAFAGWWSPHYNGHLWFDKPPLTYWLIAVSMSIFGEGAFAARFPMALCALLLVAATWGLSNSLVPKSRWSGVWAAIVVATCLQSVILARAAVTDMILAVCLTLALWGLWRWLEDARRFQPLLGAGAATGLAVLTKGPVAIVLIGGVTIIYLLTTLQTARLLAPTLWGALALALTIAMPWYLSMTRLHGALFVQGFLEANNLTRYVSAEHITTSSPFFFVPVLIGFLFPWTGAFVAAVPKAVREARAGDRAALFALIWIAWVFLFFTLSQTKLVTYIYPLYPLVAILIGSWIAAGPSRWGMAVHVLVFSVLMGGVALLLPSLVRHSLPAAVHPAALVSILLGATVAGILAAWAVSFRSVSGHARTAVFGLPACAMGLLFVPVASARFWDQPVPKVSQTELAAAIKAQTHPGDVVRAMTLERPSLVYYSERDFVFTDSRWETAAAVSHAPYPLCATRVQYEAELASHLPPGGHLKTVSQSGREFVLLRYQPPGMAAAR